MHEKSRNLLVIGLVLCVAHAGLAVAWRASNTSISSTQSWLLVAVLLAAGALWLLCLRHPDFEQRRVWVAALAMGLLMRLFYFGSPAIHEADFNRYLWDGAVLSRGLDPYEAPPSEALTQRVSRSVYAGNTSSPHQRIEWALADLADEAGPIHAAIRYADLRTIYPPGAQLAFALSHQIAPFSLDAWRGVVLVAEVLTLGLLIRMIGLARGQPGLVLVYWWNPLVIVQFASAAHVDAVLLPPLLAALWASWRRRPLLGALLLAVAASIKLWPMMLMPLVARRAKSFWSAVGTVCVGAVVAGVLISPQLRHLGTTDNGLTMFAQYWGRNALAFPLLVDALGLARVEFIGDDALARLVVLTAVCVVVVIMLRIRPASLQDHARAFAIPIAALLLLGPTGYPWYYAWLLPFLCFWPHPALLLLGTLFALCYGGFALKPAQGPEYWPLWLRALEFLPVWVGLLIWRAHVPATPSISRPSNWRTGFRGAASDDAAIR